MQSNIYAQKENGDLRLLAEIEGADDPALAVDALLDEMPRMKQRSFIVIDLDNVMVVEAEDEIVQPRRKITVQSINGGGAPAVSDTEEDEDEEDEAEEQEEEQEEEAPAAEAPKPRRGRPPGSRNRPKADAAPKRRGPGRPRGSKNSKGKGSPFKANPASAE